MAAHEVPRMIVRRRKAWVGAVGLAVLLAVLFSGGRGVERVDAVPKESYEGIETFTNIFAASHRYTMAISAAPEPGGQPDAGWRCPSGVSQ